MSMDQERSIVNHIMILVVLGVLMALVFGWVVVYYEGMEGLYSSSLGQKIILMFLVFTGTIVYFVYLRITGKDVKGENVAAANRSKDPRESSLDLDIPYQRAFELSRRSFESIPGGEVHSADAEKGIIEGRVPEASLSGPGPAKITITLQKAGPGKTRVNIHCITPRPTYHPVHLLIDSCFSRNKRYVKWIREFIEEPAHQGDGTVIGEEGENPPVT